MRTNIPQNHSRIAEVHHGNRKRRTVTPSHATWCTYLNAISSLLQTDCTHAVFPECGAKSNKSKGTAPFSLTAPISFAVSSCNGDTYLIRQADVGDEYPEINW